MATKKTWAFRTQIDEPVVIETPTGEETEEILAMKIDDNGNETFYVKGKTNVWEKIQSYESETNLENILRRVSETGDISILNQREAMFMDIEDMPENIFEAHQKIKDAEEMFNNLPLETREKYENNFNKFLKDFGTENWQKNMGLIKEVEEIKEEKGEAEE